MLGKRHESMRSLSETVSLLAEKGDVDQALRLIRDCVERIITEPLCTSQVYGSKTLDELCQRIGKVSLAAIKRETVEVTPSQREQPVIARTILKCKYS